MSNEMESQGAPMTTNDKPTMNAFQRLFGIFFSPVKTFQDINRKPSFFLPLVVMIIITVLATFVVIPKIDFEATMQYEIERKEIELTDEQIEQAAAMQGKIGGIVGPIVAGGFSIIICLIFAGLYFALLRMWKGGSTFSRVFSVTVFSFFVSVIKQIIAIPLAMQLEDKSIMSQEANNIVMTNLAAFLDWETTSRPLYAAATNIDLFNIWTIILAIFGLTAVSKLQPKQAAATVLIIWLVWIGFITGITALTA